MSLLSDVFEAVEPHIFEADEAVVRGKIAVAVAPHLAQHAEALGALAQLRLVLFLAAIKYDFDLTGSAAIERANAVLGPPEDGAA